MSAHNSIAQAHGKGGRCALDDIGEQLVLERLRAGETKKKIADDLKIHRNTVANIAKRHPEPEPEPQAPSA